MFSELKTCTDTKEIKRFRTKVFSKFVYLTSTRACYAKEEPCMKDFINLKRFSFSPKLCHVSEIVTIAL